MVCAAKREKKLGAASVKKRRKGGSRPCLVQFVYVRKQRAAVVSERKSVQSVVLSCVCEERDKLHQDRDREEDSVVCER